MSPRPAMLDCPAKIKTTSSIGIVEHWPFDGRARMLEGRLEGHLAVVYSAVPGVSSLSMSAAFEGFGFPFGGWAASSEFEIDGSLWFPLCQNLGIQLRFRQGRRQPTATC